MIRYAIYYYCIPYLVQTDFVQMTSDSPSGVAPITVNDAGNSEQTRKL